MEVDLEVLCTTINDYGQVLETATNIKDKIKNTNSTLADKGWTGEAQKKYNELLEWFLSKDYECLLENLKCVTTVLYNEAKYPGGALKDRCEDFVNCLDLSEKGYYPEGSGASSGVLSLDYDNTNSIINNIYDIIDDLLSKKRKVLKELESTIHGGWFSSGLIYCSFSIDNELNEIFNQISKEEQGLNSLLVSFQQYVPNVRGLEEGVCSGLSKVKDLGDTAVSVKNINNIDSSINLGFFGKAKKVSKSLFIDVGGGVLTAKDGVQLTMASMALVPEQPEIGIPGVVIGGATVTSGVNTAINGTVDLKHEWNGEWGDVGDTNVVKDIISGMVSKGFRNKDFGKSFGDKAMLTIDVLGAYKGFKDAIKLPSKFANDIKYRNGKFIDIAYTPPRITPATAYGSFDFQRYATIVGDAHAVGVDYYTGKTIADDVNALKNKSDSVNSIVVAAWLDN